MSLFSWVSRKSSSQIQSARHFFRRPSALHALGIAIAMSFTSAYSHALTSEDHVASQAELSSLSSQLVDHSGYEELLYQYSDMVKAGVYSNIEKAGLSESLRPVFAKVVDTAFDSELLTQRVEERLIANLNPQEMREVAAWYQSPIGQKILRAELGEVNDAQYNRIENDTDNLYSAFNGTERGQLFARFDRAIGITDSMLDNAAALELAMAATLTSLVKGPDLPSFDQLKGVIEKRRKALRGRIGHKVYLNYLYTYKDVTLAELKEYIAFAKSKAGQNYLAALNGAVHEVLAERTAFIARSEG